MIKTDSFTRKVLAAINQAGGETFFVGGCVRDDLQLEGKLTSLEQAKEMLDNWEVW